jgi:hypothetical protein
VLQPWLYVTRGHRNLLYTFPAHTDWLVVALGALVGASVRWSTAKESSAGRRALWAAIGHRISKLRSTLS